MSLVLAGCFGAHVCIGRGGELFRSLGLILPVLLPSWRFFDVIAPSPRIEFVVLSSAEEEAVGWREFRSRPEALSAGVFLRRMFWNARWNESLFLVSCAERLLQNPTEHSKYEIQRRIKRDLLAAGKDLSVAPYLRFRLVFLHRDGDAILREVAYISDIYEMEAE